MPRQDDTTPPGRIQNIEMPDYYRDYYTKLSDEAYKIFESAARAKSTLTDSSGRVEPKIAFDLADRVAKMHDINIAEQLRDLLRTQHLRTDWILRCVLVWRW